MLLVVNSRHFFILMFQISFEKESRMFFFPNSNFLKNFYCSKVLQKDRFTTFSCGVFYKKRLELLVFSAGVILGKICESCCKLEIIVKF